MRRAVHAIDSAGARPLVMAAMLCALSRRVRGPAAAAVLERLETAERSARSPTAARGDAPAG